MQLSDLKDDTYKALISVVSVVGSEDSEVGKLQIYYKGLSEADDLDEIFPEHIELAQRLGLTREQVRGCYVDYYGGNLELRSRGCGSVGRASEEIYRQAVENGVVILTE